MIEAQIICSAPCDIPDLGLYGLQRGDERWVSDLAAKRSQDLVKEQRRGAVRVYRKTRRTEAASPRRPAPPFVAHSRPSRERPEAPPQQQERVIERETVVERVEVSAPVDTEALARQMKAEILGDLLPGIRAVVQEEVGRAAANSGERAGIDAEQLENVLESVMRRVMPAGAPAQGSSPQRRTEAKEPLFIPSTIVDKDAKGRISVKSETSGETDDLDDANEMLRKMRRPPGAGRTSESEDK